MTWLGEMVAKDTIAHLGHAGNADVDPTLTLDILHEIRGELTTLPEDSTCKTKVLTEELVVDTTKAHGWGCIIRDDLDCVYQACRYYSNTCRVGCDR
jgi:hypothetical protein